MQLLFGDLCPEAAQPFSCPAMASLLSLLDTIPAVVWATDLECRLTTIMGSGLQRFGIDRNEYLGADVQTGLFSAAPSTTALNAHREALQGRHASFHVEMANGRLLEAHVEPLRGSDHGIVGVIGVGLDSTEIMVENQALRLSERNYRSFVEDAPYAICRVTMSGQILQVNPAMSKMLGFDSSEQLLETDLPLLFTDSGQFDALRTMLLGAETIQGFESSWRRHDGQEIWVSISGRAVRDRAGESLYLDVVAENVTNRKHLEAQLRQAQKMQAVGQLAGGVAHDFNNLLMIIGGQVEVALREDLEVSVQLRLEEVNRAVERAATLTRQLLAFSRRQVLQSKVLDLNRVIGHISQMLVRLIGEHIEFTFVPGDGLNNVKADPNQIEQVLMNLAVNARDAMPQGGRFTIETSQVQVVAQSSIREQSPEPGPHALITVTDTGHGMDLHTQARIFEPFFTTKEKGEGTGLGLAMVYGIVEQSGGHIEVESEPGCGARFKIYLPSVAESEFAQPAPSPIVLPRGRENILVVEDEGMLREFMASYLQSLGYRVLIAHHGLDALGKIASHSGSIDLLVTDMMMPKMGGRELATELRKKRAGLKVLFLSGYPGHEAAEKKQGFPEAAFLAKPFSIHLLARTIREVLDGPAQ